MAKLGSMSTLGITFFLLFVLEGAAQQYYQYQPQYTQPAAQPYQQQHQRRQKKRKIKDDRDDHDKKDDLLVTKKVFFDISIDDEPSGRIVIALFGETCPVTVQNFASLARGNFRGDNKLSYNNTIVHRIVQDFVIQMGDVVENDGTGGRSIYGQYFADENFYLSHWGPGWVAMANSGPDSNNSQFIILLSKARWLDRKHVVFGKVVEGMSVVEDIAEVETDEFAFPVVPVEVVNVGVIPVKNPYKIDDPEEEEKKLRKERRSARKERMAKESKGKE